MRYAIFGAVVVFIFTVFVTVFAASADSRLVRQLPKWVWILLCLFVTPIGGVLYLAVGRPVSGSGDAGKTRTIAPDDDPEFLRDLSQMLRDEDDKGKQ